MTNPWKKYRESRMVKITLEDFDMEEYFIEIMPIATYGSHEMDRISEMGSAKEQTVEMFKLWVENWNLPGADGEGVLTIPREDEDNVWLSVLPNEIQMYLITKLKEVEEERMNLPPEIAKQLSQP